MEGQVRSVYSVLLSEDKFWTVPKGVVNSVLEEYRFSGTAGSRVDGTVGGEYRRQNGRHEVGTTGQERSYVVRVRAESRKRVREGVREEGARSEGSVGGEVGRGFVGGLGWSEGEIPERV